MFESRISVRGSGRWLFAALAMALVAMALMAAPAEAKADKVDICHAEGNGSYHLISISVNAEQKHRDNHGDGMVGDAVPGMDGFTFDDDCVPVRNALAQAFSTDANGNVRLLGELLDTNGDGVPSVGDTARVYEMPMDVSGNNYFDTSSWSDCVATFMHADLDSYSGQDTVYLYGSGYNCFFQWYQDDYYYDDYFYAAGPEGYAVAVEYGGYYYYYGSDQVYGDDYSSNTVWNVYDSYANGDGAWLEVVFNFADPYP